MSAWAHGRARQEREKTGNRLRGPAMPLEKDGARLMNTKGHSEADTQKPQGTGGCDGEKEF